MWEKKITLVPVILPCQERDSSTLKMQQDRTIQPLEKSNNGRYIRRACGHLDMSSLSFSSYPIPAREGRRLYPPCIDVPKFWKPPARLIKLECSCLKIDSFREFTRQMETLDGVWTTQWRLENGIYVVHLWPKRNSHFYCRY